MKKNDATDDIYFLNEEGPETPLVLMSTRETAHYLGISPAAFYNIRAKKAGPDYIRVGRAIKYTRKDVDEWLERNKVKGEAG